MILTLYFDQAKKLLDIDTDAALARYFGLRPQELNRARKQGLCSNAVLQKLAEVNCLPYPVVFVAREADKASNEEVRGVWMEAYKRIGFAGNKDYRKYLRFFIPKGLLRFSRP